jgi:hypothetical protein
LPAKKIKLVAYDSDWLFYKNPMFIKWREL